ncbi:hypothetical protein GCK32_010822, partial [Trichostrongylus colubriformis]
MKDLHHTFFSFLKLPTSAMNSLVVAVLLALACIVLASEHHYEYGSGEYGKGHHGQDHGSSYNKGYSKGFEKEGYGDYGSSKYGGW